MASAGDDAIAGANLFRQAVEQYQQGRIADAEQLCRRALLLAPLQADPHHLLGAIAQQTGHGGAALTLLARAAELAPENAHIQSSLANTLLEQGDARAAAQAWRRALSLRPDFAAAANGLGFALRALGENDEALKTFELVVRLDPGRWEAIFNLGCAYEQSGRLQPAIECYERVLALQPDSVPALSNLGNARSELGQFDAAEAALQRVIALEPGAAMAHVNLGNVLLARGDAGGAIERFRRAIALDPGLPEAFHNLGRALQETGEFDEQVRCCEQALKLRPQYPKAMVNLGSGMLEQGRTGEAMEWFGRAAALDPDELSARANIQFAMILLRGYDMAAIYRANRDFWSGRQIAPARKTAFAHAAGPRQRLRVGYVSADLRRHAAAYFMDSILAHHDKSAFEVFCYYNHDREDEYTARLKAAAGHWRNIAHVADDAAAAAVEKDQIDILVDLAGHTANNRLDLFAKRPAPVQVTYLGYPATTGLEAIGYRLTDEVADPADADRFYSEQLWRLPASLWCYTPPPDLPDCGELPAATNGYVTFGSFNNVNKTGPGVVALWAGILNRVAGSRLLISSIPAGVAQERMRDLFAGHGIDASRLRMQAPLPHVEFLKLYREVDIALDSFPCNGATSTCESLWMGVPVVSLTGATFAGRAGLSLLTAAGCGDWVAADEAQYADIAARLAGDLAALAAIRRGLRSRMRVSPVGDAPGFTRALEDAYRGMWQRWCATRNPSSAG